MSEEISAKEMKRYITKPVKQLIKIAERHFNKHIRERDRNGDSFFCPTHANGSGKQMKIDGDNYQACHLFPAGKYSWIRFHEDNVFGGCKSCNYYGHGVGHVYGDWVRKKIGEDRYKRLTDLNDFYKRNTFQWDRFSLIATIVKYKNKK